MNDSNQIKKRVYGTGNAVTPQSGLEQDFDRFVAAHNGGVPLNYDMLVGWTYLIYSEHARYADEVMAAVEAGENDWSERNSYLADTVVRYVIAHDGRSANKLELISWLYFVGRGYTSDEADELDQVDAVAKTKIQIHYINFQVGHGGRKPDSRDELMEWAEQAEQVEVEFARYRLALDGVSPWVNA